MTGMGGRGLRKLIVCVVLLQGLAPSSSVAEELCAAEGPAPVESLRSRLLVATQPALAMQSLPREEPPRPRAWSQSLVWVGAAADLYSTKRLLETPGLTEANPVISIGSNEDAVLFSAAATKAAAFFLTRHFVRKGKLKPQNADILLGTFGGAQLLAARHNMELVREAP